LPLTDNLIETNLEPLEDFMLRRLEWAKLHFIKIRKLPTLNQLRIKAVLRNFISDNSTKVQEAIENTLIEIENTIYP
jgi:hypothetical protein